MVSDRALWMRWRDMRDAEAFRALADAYGGMVYATALRVLGSPQDAEDVAQECFETLATARKTPSAYLGPWLHRVAVNRALNRRRGDMRRRVREAAYHAERGEVSEADWDDIHRYVDEAIAALPDTHRRAVVAHFLEGRTHLEFAREEGIARSTATDRIQKGVALIREALRKKGVAVPAATLTALFSRHLAAAEAPPGVREALGRIAVSGAGSGGKIGGVLAVAAVWRVAAVLAVAAGVGGGVWWTYRTTPTGEGPPPGPVEMADAVESLERADQEPSDQPVADSADEALPGGDASTFLLTGRVFDVDSGAGIGGVKLSIERDTENDPDNIRWNVVSETTSDAGGSYAAAVTEPGLYRVLPEVSALSTPYALLSETDTVWRRGEPAPPRIDVPLTAAYTISGVITDEQGDPIGGAIVYCMNEDSLRAGIATSGEDGSYRLCVLPGDAFGLNVSASLATGARSGSSPYASIRDRFDLGPEGRSGVDLQLTRGAAVRGHVFKADGSPASGYALQFDNEEEDTWTVPSDDGAIDVYLQTAGLYEILTYVHGGQAVVAQINAPVGETVEGLKVVLPADAMAEPTHVRATGKAISGRAIYPDGSPAAGIPVGAWPDVEGWNQHIVFQQTGLDGFFALPLRAEGPHRVTAYSSGWSNGTLEPVYPDTSNLTLALRSLGSIWLRITSRDGEPIERYIVSATPQSQLRLNDRTFNMGRAAPHILDRPLVDEWHSVERHLSLGRLAEASNGEYVLEDVEAGPTLVYVLAEGYGVGRAMVDVPSGDAEPAELAISLAPEARIAGRVTDSKGMPVAGASIYMVRDASNIRRNAPGGDHVVRTDRAGRFELTGLPAGVCTLHAVRSPYDLEPETITLAPGDNVVSLAMIPRSQVAGVVRGRGVPLPGALVQWNYSEENNEARTSADGAYRIRTRATGVTELLVSHSHQGEKRSLMGYVEAGLGEWITRDVELFPGTGTVSGAVSCVVPGASQPWVTLFIVSSAGHLIVIEQTDARGVYAIEGVPAGKVQLRAQVDTPMMVKNIEFALGPNETAVHDFELSPESAN